jgi:hypothetical protein
VHLPLVSNIGDYVHLLLLWPQPTGKYVVNAVQRSLRSRLGKYPNTTTMLPRNWYRTLATNMYLQTVLQRGLAVFTLQLSHRELTQYLTSSDGHIF